MAQNHPELTLRNFPTQARAKRTFDQLLLETGKLLEEVGFEAFNTNLLAQRSGIGVRAIYRYFPNKFALVCELARRVEVQWRQSLETVASNSKTPTWPDIWLDYVDCYIDAVRVTPGGIAILRTMRSHPELRDIDEEMTRVYQSSIADTLHQKYPAKIGTETANAIAAVLMHSTVAIVDASLDVSSDEAKRLIDQLKVMHLALLESHLR